MPPFFLTDIPPIRTKGPPMDGSVASFFYDIRGLTVSPDDRPGEVLLTRPHSDAYSRMPGW